MGVIGWIFGFMLRSDTLQITAEILSLIARIDEFKGAWCALGTLALVCLPYAGWPPSRAREAKSLIQSAATIGTKIRQAQRQNWIFDAAFLL